MAKAGYLLVTLGFLGSAYVCVLDELEVPWTAFLTLLLVGAVGVAMVRIAHHRSTRHEERLAANLENIATSLDRVVHNIRRLDDEKGEIDVYDLRHRIDETFLGDLDTFVEARESIAHSHGLQAYADVMNPYAAGERYLNRVWSASTDGYIDECHTYLAKARQQFEEAQAKFRSLGGEAPGD